jgi:hypothetical protein
MTFDDVVKKYVRLPSERWVSYAEIATFDLSKVEMGVVFLLAPWSGVAQLVLKEFSELIRNLKPENVQLIILNLEAMQPDEMKHLFGDVQHGYGETFFVNKGNIVGKVKRPGENRHQEFTREFGAAFGINEPT